MKTVAVVNYGMGNVDSVVRSLEECGAEVTVTDREEDFESAGAVVLPGVGSFSDGMRCLRERGLTDVLRRHVFEKDAPFLGICLGMQLLASRGEEGGDTPGLGWVPGTVRKFTADRVGVRIPHAGWNEVNFKGRPALFEGIEPGRDFYFVHSYRFIPDAVADVLAETPYCGSFASAVQRNNIFGVQFHPEKSQKVGLRLLKNFLAV